METGFTYLITFLQQLKPHDSGPIYQETEMNRFPVEPFNTLSNLVFICILVFFLRRIYKHPKNHVFLWIALPIIFISWIGGTIFHATRSHPIWLALDWMPIMLVCLLGIFYFISKIYREWWKRILFFIILVGVNFGFRKLSLPRGFAISVGYAITALSVLTPFFLYAYKTQWKNVRFLLIGMLIFTLAITFRTLDGKVVLLPMGTHWLWHIFGGIAVFFLLYYIYRDDLELAKLPKGSSL
jgi:hemolysin III